MSWEEYKFKDFLKRSKIPILIENEQVYKRVTIKIKHNGVSLRDTVKGIKIGTKKQFILKAGQFILSKIDARYGAFGIAPEETDNAIITGNFWAYDVDFNIVNIDWFNQFINSQDFYNFCERASSGITHRKYLNEEAFLNSVIYLPEIKKQQKIIDEFRTNKKSLINISTELTHQLNLVKQLRQAFLHEAMQGKLMVNGQWSMVNDELTTKKETGAELLAKIKVEKEQLIKEKKLKRGKASSQSVSLINEIDIPENWVWAKINEIFFVTKLAGFEYSKHISLRPIGEIPVIRAQNVRPFEISKKNLLYIDRKTSELLNRCALTKEVLLVTFIGAGIGDVAHFHEKERWHLAPNVAKLEPFDGCENMMSLKFLNYFLMSDNGKTEIFKHIKATAQPSLSMGTIRDIDLPLPPLSEQKRIVAKLDKLMAYCDSLEESIKNSQTQNKMLLGQVLREALEPKTKKEIAV